MNVVSDYSRVLERELPPGMPVSLAERWLEQGDVENLRRTFDWQDRKFGPLTETVTAPEPYKPDAELNTMAPERTESTQGGPGPEAETSSKGEVVTKPEAKQEKPEVKTKDEQPKPEVPSIAELGTVFPFPIPVLIEIQKAIAANPNGEKAKEYKEAKANCARSSRSKVLEQYKQKVCRDKQGKYYSETKVGNWATADITELREQLESEKAFEWVKDMEEDPKKHRPIKDSFVSELRTYARSENEVAWAGCLAGYRKGIRTVGGEKYLFKKGPRVIEPKEGDYSKIQDLLSQMFGDQLPFLEGWLKWGYDGLVNEKGGEQPGQGLFIIGDPGDGKTFITHEIIIPILGGRHADPMAMVRNNSQFNSLEGESEVLLMDDDPKHYDGNQRSQFANRVKQVTAARTQRLEAKYQEAITANPFWRLVVLANHDSVSAFPTIEDSVKGKVMFLKTEKPSVKYTPEELREQLPAYIHHLQEMAIPDSLKNPDSRYGVLPYHHEDVVKSLEDLSPEANMWNLIDSLIFRAFGKTDEWKGGSQDLYGALTEAGKVQGRYEEVRAVVKSPHSVGLYLAKLVGPRCDNRIGKRVLHGNNRWVIQPPKKEADELDLK